MTITFLSVMMALLFLLYGATSASHPTRPSILDFIFAGAYSHGLLLIGAPLNILADSVSAIIGALLLSIAVEGYFKGPVAWWGRVLLTGTGFCLFVPPFGWTVILAGTAMAVAAFLLARGLRDRIPAKSSSLGAKPGRTQNRA